MFLFLLICFILFYVLFAKYFKNAGKYPNITSSRYGDPDIFMKDVNLFPLLNGWKLKLACRLVNTRLVQYLLAPLVVKGSLIREIRNCVCNFKPTYYERVPNKL